MQDSTSLIITMLGMGAYIGIFADGNAVEKFAGVLGPSRNVYIVSAIVKSLPILQLCSRVLFARVHDRSAMNLAKYVGFGLLFSAIGDIMLDLVPLNELTFLVGLGSFLIGHIWYIFAFRSVANNFSIPKLLLAIAPLTFVVSKLYPYLLLPKNVELFGPVIAYVCVITTMLYTSMLRTDKSKASRIFGVLGAAFFTLSDSILAWDKFAVRFPEAKFVVMVTYYLAQIFISQSAIAATSVIPSKEAKNVIEKKD